MSFPYSTLLVTGGAGFIGSHFVKTLLREVPQQRLLILDALTYAGNLENLEGILDRDNVLFIRGNVCDSKTVQSLTGHADAIVHFAAETHVDRSILSSAEFLQTDIFGTYTLLEAAREAKVKKFLLISSDEVYGEAGEPPPLETAPLYPKSPYAASKASADRLAYSYFATFETPVVISRSVNNYGPFQHPEKLIPFFITQALQDKPLPVYGSGENSREWIYVEDHCEALLELLTKKGIEGEAFNIGTREERSVLDIAQAILESLGKPKERIQLVQDRPGHVLRHAVQSEKIAQAISWKPKVSFAEGLERTVAWYSQNERWWRRARANPSFAHFAERWYKERRWQ